MKRWVVFKAVFFRTIVEMRRYAFNTVAGLVTMYLIFLLLFLGAKFVGGPTFATGGSLEGLVVGYLVWLLALIAYQDLAWQIASEAEIGTLEQLYLSPAGVAWVNGCYLLARFLVTLLTGGLILVLMMLTTGRLLHLDLVSLIPLTALTVASAYGFGFVMGGLALVFKRIQQTFQILQFVFVAFLIAPVGRYAWLKYMPLALGNELIRRVMVDGVRLWRLPPGDLGLATLVGLGYFLAGLGAFGWCLRVARDRGMLGQY